jgi:ribosomal protein S27AE
MKESLTPEQIGALMRPEDFDLGQKLTGQGSGVCPLCHLGGKMAVHENGVRFACGHLRWLPSLHASNGDQCKKCHPELGNVIPITRGAKPVDLDAITELMDTYVGLR